MLLMEPGFLGYDGGISTRGDILESHGYTEVARIWVKIQRGVSIEMYFTVNFSNISQPFISIYSIYTWFQW